MSNLIPRVALCRRARSLLGSGWQVRSSGSDLFNHFYAEHCAGPVVEFSYHDGEDPLRYVAGKTGRGVENLVRAIRKAAWGDDLEAICNRVTDAPPENYEALLAEFRAMMSYESVAVRRRLARIKARARKAQKAARRENRK